MKASDLNNKIDDLAKQHLVPFGFKKSGLHYYCVNDRNEIFALIKNTQKGLFDDYYFAYSHECTGEMHNDLLQKISPLQKDYPVSARIDDLEIIYNNLASLKASNYYFYSLARTWQINSKAEESESVWAKNLSTEMERNKKLSEDEEFVNAYAENTFSNINTYRAKFFEDCNVLLCYRAVEWPILEKKNIQYITHYKRLIDNIRNYAAINNIAVPEITERRQGWFKNLFK